MCGIEAYFYKPPASHLIKATQPFERLNLDFKGPLPTSDRNSYILTVVDEFSRFPFAFPCSDVSTATVIGCLNQLFAIFGMPAYVHSDRGASFMSKELGDYLTSKGIATSRTTPYRPQCNGQTERYNGIIWNAVKLTLRTRELEVSKWNIVLADALHSIRSLLCTATNTTPHERFFNFQRRSSSGYSIPSWLTTPGKVLLRRHIRHSKHDPLVDEVELVSANPSYALVRFPSGREDTVSIRDLAPHVKTAVDVNDAEASGSEKLHGTTETDGENDSTEGAHGTDDDTTRETTAAENVALESPDTAPAVRRSSRLRHKPDRYGCSRMNE